MTDSGGSPQIAWGSADQPHQPVARGGGAVLSVNGSEYCNMLPAVYKQHLHLR